MPNDEHESLVRVLTRDHLEVADMFARLERGDIGDARNRKALVEEITVALVRHFVVEEQHLYPVVRDVLPGGLGLADRGIAEHARAERLLRSLERLAPQDAAFDVEVAELMAVVRNHVGKEESEIFPRLAEACPAEQLQQLGDRAVAAKRSAPTRPHPNAPHTPPANLVTGPALGLVDRLRDALTGRGA